MTVERFIEAYPRLYHMAAAGAWPSIARYGLLSTTAVLDLVGVSPEERMRLEASRRPESVELVSSSGDRFVIRDQKPLSLAKLGRCLVDMTVGEWLLTLNRKVFMWPTRARCERLVAARAYRDSKHTVVELDTAALVERHGDDLTLSPINSGSVLYDPPLRGSKTFLSIDRYPFEERRRQRGSAHAVAEVAVEYGIPDVLEVMTSVYEASASGWNRLGR